MHSDHVAATLAVLVLPGPADALHDVVVKLRVRRGAVEAPLVDPVVAAVLGAAPAVVAVVCSSRKKATNCQSNPLKWNSFRGTAVETQHQFCVRTGEDLGHNHLKKKRGLTVVVQYLTHPPVDSTGSCRSRPRRRRRSSRSFRNRTRPLGPKVEAVTSACEFADPIPNQQCPQLSSQLFEAKFRSKFC